MKDSSERSGVSVPQIMKALALDASESVCRRLDAFLDAKNLHKLQRDSALLRDLERMSYELWRFWEAKTLPMQYIYAMTVEKQQRLRTAMKWRLKKLLRERVEKETGKEPHFPDGASYWRLKERFYRDGQFVPPHRKPDRGAGTSPMGEGR